MKRIFLVFALLCTVVLMWAGNFKYMVLETRDGGKVNVVLNGVNVRFADGVMQIENGGNTWMYNTEKVSRFYFSESEQVRVDGVVADDADGGIVVYDIEGRRVGRFESKKSMEAALPRGIFIIQSKDVFFKKAIK